MVRGRQSGMNLYIEAELKGGAKSMGWSWRLRVTEDGHRLIQNTLHSILLTRIRVGPTGTYACYVTRLPQPRAPS
jgi:hypothetical protein